jgi:hypothetical protein
MSMPVNCKAEQNIHVLRFVYIIPVRLKVNFDHNFPDLFCIGNVGRRMDHINCQMLSVFSLRHDIPAITKIEWKYRTGKKFL